MRKYIALSLIGIFFLASCAKDQSAPASPSQSPETQQAEASSAASSQKPSTVDVQTSLFEKAVAERNEEKCKQVEDVGQQKSCITLVQQSKEQDKTFSQ